MAWLSILIGAVVNPSKEETRLLNDRDECAASTDSRKLSALAVDDGMEIGIGFAPVSVSCNDWTSLLRLDELLEW